MTGLIVRLRLCWSSRGGQSMAEYAIVLATVAVVALGAYKLLGTQISSYINTVKGCL